MEGYLHLRISPWIRRLLTRLLAVIPAFLVIWLRGEENTGELLIFSQVILSMQLGFAVIPLIHFVSDKKLMGKFAIRTWAKIASWTAASIIILLNAKVVSNGIQALFVEFSGNHLILYLTIFPVITAAVVLLIYILIQPLLPQREYLSRGMHKEFLPLDFELKNDFKRVAVALDFSAKDKETLSRALTTGGKNADYLLIHVVESAGALIMIS
jgi:manganese transport protein